MFVATDHEAAGTAAGKLLATLVGDADEVSFLKHSQTSGATGQREAGAMAAFRETHAKSTIHGDIYAWNPSAKPSRPEGGEAQMIRALYALIAGRYRR